MKKSFIGKITKDANIMKLLKEEVLKLGSSIYGNVVQYTNPAWTKLTQKRNSMEILMSS